MPGTIIYRGHSMIDGAPIVVVFLPSSTNRKTGDMAQTYILRSDMPPMDAARSGADASICGGCVHRGKVVDGKNVGRSCYVTLFQGPRSVYDAFARGVYMDLASTAAKSNDEIRDDAIAEIGAGQLIRLGTYGDPAAVPVRVWDVLLSRARGHTGYTHQWKAPRLRAVTKYCQASCDSATDVEKAKDLGLGIFYVMPQDSSLPDGFWRCPASVEMGHKKTCADCLMCDGNGNYIAIDAHGSGAGHVNRRSLPTLN
jgi:hypothetical protein